MSRLAMMSTNQIKELVDSSEYCGQDLIDLYEYSRMLRYEQDCINGLGHQKIEKLEQEIRWLKDRNEKLEKMLLELWQGAKRE